MTTKEEMLAIFKEIEAKGFAAPPEDAFYAVLVKLGLLKEGEDILGDNFYDREAVAFAIKVLQQVK